MSSTYGENLKLSIFGQSHGPAIGMTLDGIPAGLPVDLEKLQAFLNRRAPGQNDWSTPRKEEDKPEFLGGILDGYTCGAPIAAVIHNKNTRSGDYDNLKDVPRPGHADYTFDEKYGFRLIYNGNADEYICLEPQNCLANCANSPFSREEAGLDYIEPGKSKEYVSKIYIHKGRI